jgi:4-amino-4-deoxy-L-arabinose transferase-like glycosyltransferase
VLFVPLLAGLGVYMSTDPVVVFFCALSLPAVYSAVTRGGWLRWMAAGAVAGLALLSKFLCLFTFAGMFLFLLLSQEDRKWFIRPQPYVAALIAIAVFSPFLLWNYSHDWATFKFNLVTRQSQNAFAPSHIPEFIGAQMFAVSPFVFVLGVAGLVSAWKAWKMEKARPLMYLLCAAAVPLAYFLVASFRRRVGLHWPACGWLPVLVLLPLMHVRGRLSLLWMRIMLWSCLALTILIHVALVTPPGMLRRVEAMMGREPVRFEDERYGWREIGGWVESVRERMAVEQGEKQRGVFLMTGQYGVSAALAFYMPGQPAVHLWAPRRTHGENYRFWDDFRSMALQDAIYVAKSEDRASGAMEMLRRHFTYVHDPEKLTVKVDGEEVRSFYIIKCFIYDGVEPDFSG